jgi:hypothetical protein
LDFISSWPSFILASILSWLVVISSQLVFISAPILSSMSFISASRRTSICSIFIVSQYNYTMQSSIQ